MPGPISEYAVIGDCETAALVRRNGSIDWLCWPRFDSEACFSALLAGRSGGAWTLTSRAKTHPRRRYSAGTLILETRLETEAGAVKLIDFMPLRDGQYSDLVRMVIGERGPVPMQTMLNPRFDFGRLRPWTKQLCGRSVEFIAGPHAVTLETPVDLDVGDGHASADFTVQEGETFSFVLRYRPSYSKRPEALDANRALASTETGWRNWSSACTYEGPWREQVVRSLITIKAMTSRPTGGIIAAPTTSLPEHIGGERNWDYRFCWLRDATFTLLALLHSGFHQEAREWRDWMLRAVAGMPDDIQPIYGVAGEHRLAEREIGWLDGYRGSRPVRIGNAAYRQLQLDVFGELIDALHQARENDIPPSERSWELQRKLIEKVEAIWREPDAGIWEARHGREHFTHSKVMAWVAIDRAIRAGERKKLGWPMERWKALRDSIHRDVCEQGFDRKIGAFVRSYETRELDASTLLIPAVGFLPPSDPRVRSTLEAIERHLMPDGFVRRYDTSAAEDGVSGGEGAFLACSFWYVDNLVLQGRTADARKKFEELIAVSNDVGLLSEEYDPNTKELLGNFPQTLSHLSLVNAAHNLASNSGPAHARSRGSAETQSPA